MLDEVQSGKPMYLSMNDSFKYWRCKSFADDLNIQWSTASDRVPLLVRFTEIKPFLNRTFLIRGQLVVQHQDL